MTDNLFVIVMPIGSKNEHQNGIVVDSIYQTMLLGDVPAPTSLRLAFQRLRMASARFWMLHEFKEHFCHLLERFGFVVLQLLQNKR